MKKQTIGIGLLALGLLSTAHAQNWTETRVGNWTKVTNKSGQSLGYATASG